MPPEGDAKQPHHANPLKDEGQSKPHTRDTADRARPDRERVPVDETETGQGGSHKGGGEADTEHPSQHGGVKPDLPEHDKPYRKNR